MPLIHADVTNWRLVEGSDVTLLHLHTACVASSDHEHQTAGVCLPASRGRCRTAEPGEVPPASRMCFALRQFTSGAMLF